MPGRFWAALLILAATAALYLGYVAWLGTAFGFPLDDSWIHQTFARNLVTRGEFAFNVGEPSTASTSPLWTLLLTLGYLLPGDFRYWAYVLGLLFLGLTSWVGYLLYRQLFGPKGRFATLAALAILLEWHLAWAAVSGMETSLFAFSSLWLIYLGVLALREELSTARLCLLGAVAGLTTVVRPEGAALAAIALGAAAWHQKPRYRVVVALGSCVVLVLPLLAFNMAVSGTPLPSTFNAKYYAYAQPIDPGFFASYLVGALAVLAEGPLVAVLPGVGFVAYRVVRRLLQSPSKSVLGDELPFLLIGSWVAGVLVLYMWRLPALFHHGRYLMPLIPPLLVVGLGGLVRLAEVLPLRHFSRAYGWLASALFLILWVNGAVVYAWDVKFIEDEQVSTAKWLDENVPAKITLATHDIGAIGYFSGREIIDTAGLITPELAPFVKDQGKILSYLEGRRADYLVVFPKWYPSMVTNSVFEEVFRIEQPYAVQSGADNMRVYKARW